MDLVFYNRITDQLEVIEWKNRHWATFFGMYYVGEL
jgi:hypothetical protein